MWSCLLLCQTAITLLGELCLWGNNIGLSDDAVALLRAVVGDKPYEVDSVRLLSEVDDVVSVCLTAGRYEQALGCVDLPQGGVCSQSRPCRQGIRGVWCCRQRGSRRSGPDRRKTSYCTDVPGNRPLPALRFLHVRSEAHRRRDRLCMYDIKWKYPGRPISGNISTI